MNWYDMNMRMYDPALARWMVQDPVIHYTKSTYNAFDNNPVYFADPSGATAEGSNDGNSGGIESIQLRFGVTLANVAGVGAIESTAAPGYGGNTTSGNHSTNKRKNDGDYYNKDGNWVGNDGKNDSKVYVQDSNGNIKFGLGTLSSGGLFSEVELTNELLNMLSILLTIRTSEGHGTPVPYNFLYGGVTFDDYSQHPNIEVSKWEKRSTAAGAYQFLSRTWNMNSKNLGLTDFSPYSQNRAAIAEIGLVKGASNLISNGDYIGALNKLSGKWTSLPGGIHAWKGFTYNIFLENRASILDNYKKK